MTGNDLKFGQTIRGELEDDYRVFYVTAWGYAADHYFGWLPKALNTHKEIFALLAHEGSRPKYMKERLRSERPDLDAFTEFLNDMGMTYEAIGDCYSYRAAQFSELLADPRYAGIPVVNLIRHPAVWLEFYVQWRAGNMRMRAGSSDPLAHEWRVASHGLFGVLGLKPYDRSEIAVWAAYQGMSQMNGIHADVRTVPRTLPIERIVEDQGVFGDLVATLTKGRVTYTQDDLDRAYSMVPTLFRGEAQANTDPEALIGGWPGWKVDAFRKLVKSETAALWRSFGYDMHGIDRELLPAATPVPAASRPIFVSSTMKSGTWLMRAILQELTGLTPYEPFIAEGEQDYGDEKVIEFSDGHYFTWHSVLNKDVKAVLRAARSRNVFVVRNIFDIILSMLNHIQQDVDAAIGRSVGGAGEFDDDTPEMSIALVINGFVSKRMAWQGIAPHLKQMESLFQASSEGLGTLVVYEGLVAQKEATVRSLADALQIPVTDDDLSRIVKMTTVERMRQAARRAGNEGHFRTEVERQPRSLITRRHVEMVDLLMLREAPRLRELANGVGMSFLLEPYAA